MLEPGPDIRIVVVNDAVALLPAPRPDLSDAQVTHSARRGLLTVVLHNVRFRLMKLPASEHTILELLEANESCYGLELVAASEGRLTRGGIYVTLGRMEQKGLVISDPAEGGRRLYRATGLGERALLAARIFSGDAALEAKS